MNGTEKQRKRGSFWQRMTLALIFSFVHFRGDYVDPFLSME